MNADRHLPLDTYLGAICDDAARLAACADEGDLATPVASCPGWDLRRLIVHTGGVHRWATHAIRDAAAPVGDVVRSPDENATGEEIGAWLRLGAGVLTDVLATTPLDSDTWHPFPGEQKAWVWSRRQAHETMMHRWDAEVAAVGTSSIDVTSAADGLREFFEMLLPRALAREAAGAPNVSLHVHCTNDTANATIGGDWFVWGDGGDYRMETAHRNADATIRASADALLLALMGRADGSDLDVVGDTSAVSGWFELPGL